MCARARVRPSPAKNGLMGANEPATCHHNAERPLVRLGARVPTAERRGEEGGG